MGRVTLRTGGKILYVIAAREDVSAGDIMSKHVNKSAQNLIRELRGRARKRAHCEAVGGKKKKKGPNIKRAPIKIITSDIFPSFASLTLQQPILSAEASAQIASVSSVFDIFAHRLLRTSVIGKTETPYKP